MQNNKLSIIIPCLNERVHLEKTLPSLIRNMSLFEYKFEILLIDNGSNDGSTELADSLGITTIIKPDFTISMLRNLGVDCQSADFLVFLDADVEITDKWVKALSNFVETIDKDALIITGSPCLRPSNASLLERHWFNGREFSDEALNSGNLITTKRLYRKAGGFDPKMITGEDWDFCFRAKNNGATIKVDPSFRVYHHGFPKTPIQFFRRELWHGQGDFVSFASFVKSKPGIVAVLNVLFLAISISYVIIANSYITLILYLLALSGLAAFISIKRSNKAWQVPGNTILAILYIYARSGSLIKILTKQTQRADR